MGSVIKLEVARLFKNRKSLIIFLCILIISLYFVNQGIIEYKNLKNKKEVFFEYENAKLERYFSWDQYGTWGFGLFYEPSHLIVFFNNSTNFQDIETNIDTTEVINISVPFKGKSLFKKGDFRDFAGIIFLFGSLFMLFMGLINFRSNETIKFVLNGKYILLSICSRLFFLNLAFALIFLINYMFAIFRGIAFSSSETTVFLSYSLYTFAFLTLFYIMGLLVSTLSKSRSVVVTIVIWFVTIFIVPELNKIYLINKSQEIPYKEKLNRQKIGVMMDYEREVRSKLLEKLKENITREDIKNLYKENVFRFLNKGYVLNQNREAEYTKLMAILTHDYEGKAVILPFTFYGFLTHESSSKGYYSYLNFLDYITKIRDQFIRFYLHNRYEKFGKKIESFAKGDENVFKASSRIPRTYWTGMGLTVLYSIILFIISNLVLIRRLRRVPQVPEKPILEYQEGTSHFILCKDAAYRNELFSYYESQQDIAGLDHVAKEEIETDIRPDRSVKYISAVRGVNVDDVWFNLAALGLNQKDLRYKKGDHEILKKVYAAIIASGPEKILVANEFLESETRTFEKDFLNLVTELKKSGKMVVYLSTQMFSLTKGQEEKAIKLDYNRYVDLDLEDASLR